MKMTKWIMICLLAVALVPAGCGKKDAPGSVMPQVVTLDVPKLRAAFEAASPELKALADSAISNIQFGRSYSAGLATLEQLAGASALTEEQKKVVTDVIGQVKQMMGGSAAPPAQ